jgi:hypothetical protein
VAIFHQKWHSSDDRYGGHYYTQYKDRFSAHSTRTFTEPVEPDYTTVYYSLEYPSIQKYYIVCITVYGAYSLLSARDAKSRANMTLTKY